MEEFPQWDWQEMCGPSGFIIWNKDRKDIGPCFQSLCIKIPTFILLAMLSSYYCGKPTRRIVRSKKQLLMIGTRCLVITILAIIPIAEVCLLIIKAPKALHYVDYLTKGTQTLTWCVHLCYCLTLKSRLTLSPRGPMLIAFVWLLTLVESCMSARSTILGHNPQILDSHIDFVFSISVMVLQGVYALTMLPGNFGGAEEIFEERRPLVSSVRSTYSRFQEERDPYYLGVAQEDSTVISNLLFYWVNPLMDKGVAGKINNGDDLYDLPFSLTSATINQKMQLALMGPTIVETSEELPPITEPLSRQRTVSLFVALHKCFGCQFYGIGLLKLLGDCAGFVGPMLLNGLVTFIENKSEPIEHGYMYAGGLFVSTAIAAFCNAHFNFLMSIVGLKIRASLITTVYRKTVSLSTTSLSKFSLGSIVNFMSTDTDRIVNSCPSFHAFWSIPFQIGVTLYLLYVQVGLAFLAGVAFSIILIPINKCIASKIGELSTKLMECKDLRVKTMAEILYGIRVLKLHVWEDHFIRKIGKQRDNEMKYLKGRKYLDALCVYFWATTPVLISILTFTTYALMGNQLTAAKVFTSIALLNMLIAPLNAFPWVLNGLTEAWVSLLRIQKLLELPDLDLRHYYSVADDVTSTVKVDRARFQWGDIHGEHHEFVPDYMPNSRFSLQDISFQVQPGQLIGVIGQVGCGKSSLLAALLAELERTHGFVSMAQLDEGFGFVAQKPWLQRGTIRENILFGSSYEHNRYKSVLEACCLEDEIHNLPGGDLTGVGEGGATLSGGQRARVALARAVFQDKPTYLLDDILSAVDPHVARTIFSKCIMGLLQRKTRLLCTHHRQFLQAADWLIVLKDGQISMQGKPADILDECDQILSTAELEEQKTKVEESKISALASDQGGEVTSLSDSLFNEEEREVGSVRFSVYRTYWLAVGHLLGTAVLLSLLLMQASRNLTDWWLAYWVTHATPKHNTTFLDAEPSFIVGSDVVKFVHPKPPVLRVSVIETNQVTFYLSVYAAIAGLNSVFTLFRAFLFAYGGIHAATSVHKKLLKSVMRAKVLFFDMTPLGRILNRFSSDTYTVDDSLPFILNILMAQFFGLLGSLTVTVYGLPWLGLVLVPLLPVYHWLQHYYRLTSRELKRICSVTLSPVYTHFSETLQGLTTIRALRATDRFQQENEVHVECSQKAQFSSQAAAQWLNLRLQFVGVALVGGVGLISAVQHHFAGNVDPGLVGLAISYALSVTGLLSGLVSAFTETEKEMIAVERAQQYIKHIEPEMSREVIAPPYAWPSQGVITFHAVDMKYREHGAACLRNVTFQTHPAEKIGIVGRTGAGKSSIFAALFRMTETLRGQILIDSVNIAHIGLRSLRSRLSVIPQEPFLFSGSVRENVDPLNQYAESELWSALKRCHLDIVVSRLGGLEASVGDRGSLLSVGQQQLLCLARSVLHNAKILCIDEATANVDKETDQQIQETIRSSFFQSTVLTIAHRVQTVLDCDRVLVMGDGEVLEFDTPDTLLQNTDSYFYKMVYD